MNDTRPRRFSLPALLLAAFALLPLTAGAQLVISDTLTGKASTYDWQALNGACLTAGDGSTSTIPACVGLPYYKYTWSSTSAGPVQTTTKQTLVGGVTGRLTSPDPVGQGALRLTNGDVKSGGSNGDYETGAVVSNFTFPTNQGLQVTFTTVTYGGDGLGGASGNNGADGITFFLADGTQNPTIGASGGSLGYSCSNGNPAYNGVVGGYLGVGIDEYGNFSNPGDNTNTGPGFGAPRISVRGAGSTAWSVLSSKYPQYYPSGLSSTSRQSAVWKTCATGYLWNYSGAAVTDANGVKIKNGNQTTEKLAYNYPLLAYSNLPAGTDISNQEATSYPKRGNAKPITYALSITQDGLLNLSYSYNGGAAVPVITNESISASNGPVPASFRFGFSAGTGGGSNVHEITCFKAAQLNAASTSAGVNVQQSSRVQAGTQVYLAYYHPTNWWGQLTATNLVYDASTDTVSLATLSNWDASCVLTGGSCSATGGSNSAEPSGTGAAGSGTRQLMTWGTNSSGTAAGVPLQWSNLTTGQKGVLTAGDTTSGTPNADRLGWLRGDRVNEIGGSGNPDATHAVLRARNGVLGDIVDSSPTWVGPPSLPYKGPWRDALYPAATMPEGTSYATFATSNATRTNVVYAGGNDGFMHGFRAGAYKADGTFDTGGSIAPNDGKELIGYMPSSALATIHSTTAALDFSSPSYAHALSVDATPGTGDLYYNGAWHTWLVGGMGGGGNAGGPIGNNTGTATGGDIFALDITNPGNFSEANAGTLVIGDWGPNGAAISCVANTPANCGNNLGNTYGTPIIRRLHDGNWGVIFGNGLNSATGTAGIYIMEVSSAGAISFRFLDTGYGPSQDPLGAGNKNGIAYVSSADLDGDHVTDFVYAGDRFGNLWRFDLTSSNAASWAAGTAPIFSTPGGQPITSRVTVTSALAGSNPGRVLISFGTGQKLPQTLSSAASYASGTQSLYGIWDWNMSNWNAKGSTQYASLTAPQTITAAKLQTQTATDVAGSSGSISGYRTVTQNKVCWAGSTTCSPATSNTKFGWQLALPDSGEQIIYNPTTAYGLFIVNTTIPAVANQALSCDSQPPTGYTMAIASDTGGAPTSSFFAAATNNYVSASGAIVAGIGLSAVGTPSFVSAMTKPYMVNQTASGIGQVTQVNPGAGGIGQRLNWIKLR